MVSDGFVLKFARECVKELNKKKYELGKRVYLPTKTMIRTHTGRGSCAGGDGLIIGTGYTGFEYARIQHDPIIGEVRGKVSHETLMKKVISHEVAHYVHHRKKYLFYEADYPNRLTKMGDKANKPHGYVWQTLYRYLCETLVNEHIINEGGKIGK